ncbi:MAG: ribosome maturation factor RimM [Methyloceanibacter sp.]
MPDRPDRVLLGEIGAAQGLKGEVRIRSFTAVPADIASYGPLEDESGARLIELASARVTPKALIAGIKGVSTREAAEALTGTKLYLPRSRLPEREEGEYYHSDLIGLAAIGRDGAAIGTVIAVHNFGAGDLLEIRPSDGGADVLVPFTQEVVPEVDMKAGTLVVVPVEGLFD